MTILTVIIVGGIVGWLAGKIMGRDEGIFASILIGIVGSFIGSFVSAMLTGSDRSYLAFSWTGFFWSLIGAIILVAIMNAMSSRRHHPTV
jgi:uncharacterized membrane protein YeaQ/YmgE (transglycosylase-associated protein family)